MELEVVYEEIPGLWRVVDDEGRGHGNMFPTREEAEAERERILEEEDDLPSFRLGTEEDLERSGAGLMFFIVPARSKEE